MFVVSESPLKHLVSQNQTHSSFISQISFFITRLLSSIASVTKMCRRRRREGILRPFNSINLIDSFAIFAL